MAGKIGGHIRSNVIGYVALFVALSGTAYAVDGPLPGQDQVGSADIINNEVQSADIKDANLTTADIRAGAVTTGKILDGEVQSGDVRNNSITGDDVDESTLGRPIYAQVNPEGVVQNDDGQSEGIEPSMVYKPTDPATGSPVVGTYCFKDLPFDAKTGMATSISPAIATSVVVATSGWPGDCNQGDEAQVQLRTTGGEFNQEQPIDQYFTVWFTD
jgi:hypothetical protein